MERLAVTRAQPLLAVRDLRKSLAFYQEVLGLEIVSDFGAHVVLSGGLALQTLNSWAGFLDRSPSEVRFGGCCGEIYLETEDFDVFLTALGKHPEAEYVHPVQEHRWGQRVVRLYDPDRHIVEVGEPIARVARRFRDGGLSAEGVARRMDVPLEQVREWLK